MAGADSVCCLSRSFVVVVGVMIVCGEEGVIVGLEEGVECVGDCF